MEFTFIDKEAVKQQSSEVSIQELIKKAESDIKKNSQYSNLVSKIVTYDRAPRFTCNEWTKGYTEVLSKTKAKTFSENN